MLIEARGLAKAYDGKRVVAGVDLDCPAGSVLGLLGPNGAGKTTTLRMLYGLLTPDAGTIRYLGEEFSGAARTRLKRWIGVCTQEDTLDAEFDVRANLARFATYFRPAVPDAKARVESLIDRFGLREHVRAKPDELSGGFKRRLMIARAVVHAPRVLFLDEPTTGLDPQARLAVWELVADLRREGLGIVLTTHYMDEAERLSDALVVLKAGTAVARGAPKAVIGQMIGSHVAVIPAATPRRAELDAWLRDRGLRAHEVLSELQLPLRHGQLAEFSARFADLGFVLREPTLDDLFLTLAEAA